MDCRQARNAIEDILSEGGTPVAYPELEDHLGTCAHCRVRYRRERQAIQRLEQVEPLGVPPDFGQRVIDRLPDMPLEALNEVVRVVLRAWREPTFREQLRSAPRSTLERLGISLPMQLRVVVVPPSEAALPTRDQLALPLPAADEGFLDEKDLQAQMRGNAAAFWLVPELTMARLTAEAYVDGASAAGTDSGVRPAWDLLMAALRRLARRRVLAPVLAAAATLLLALGLLYLFGADVPPGTPGAATGPWSAVAIAAVILAVVVAVSLILWHRKR